MGNSNPLNRKDEIKLKLSKDTQYKGTIIAYGLIIIALFVGFGKIYGSYIDWLGQHSVIPDVFRQNFYQTGRFIPNFIFDLGGGQNVYNFAYYGFLSPIFLISYALPFVSMTAYVVAASIIIYLSCGLLTYKFAKNHFGKKESLIAAIIFMSISPIFIQFHRHIMYVWYLPFLIMAFMGLDRYFAKNKCDLFIVSTVCIILTNYYFSVGCLVALCIYAVYNVLKEESLTFKTFMTKSFFAGCMFVIAVLLCGFLLLPTVGALTANQRPYHIPIDAQLILIPQAKQIFYDFHSYGLSLAMFIAILGNLFCKKIKKSDVFLNIVLLIITVLPLVPYALNGMLYIRSKVMIPFVILYVYNFIKFMRRLRGGRIKIKIPLIITGLFIAITYLINCDDYSQTDRIWYAIAAAELLGFALCLKKPKVIYAYTIVLLIAGLVYGNTDNHYIPIDDYKALYINEVEDMLEKAPKDKVYRSNVAYREEFTCNRTYGDNFFGTSAYSSTPNRLYLDFYEKYMGNNEQEINSILVTGAKNELFYTFMGTRYTFGDRDPGFLSEKVADSGQIGMYENKHAYPIAYKSKRLMSEEEFESLKFPYTAEALMTHTVADGNYTSDYTTVITKHEVEPEYVFDASKMEGYDKETETLKYDINLGEKYRNKNIYLTFNLNNHGEFYNKHHVKIILNGICNTLSNRWTYYNENTKFDYVIPMEDTTTISVEVTKGKYSIYGLEMYTSDVIYEDYEAADNLKFNKKNDTITCSVNGTKGEYLVTSIPYDKGFSATINGESAEIMLVNKAFVGLRLTDGKNDIILKYRSPLLDLGFIVSIMGILALIAFLLRSKITELVIKYKEIVMYLVFGVLTTVVSIASYYGCTLVFLNPQKPIELQAANVISWIISVTFAYVTNKLFVFESHGSIVKEAIKFYTSRLGTLGCEIVLMYVFVTLLKLNDLPVKIAVQFVVIAANYVLSKLIVFKEKNK